MKKIVCLLLVCVFGLMLFAQPERDFLDTEMYEFKVRVNNPPLKP